MAKARDYEVTLFAAQRNQGFVTIKYDLTGKAPKHEITAAGMDDLVEQVTRIGIEHGSGCLAAVRVLSGRKPPGFDKATENLVFNLGPEKAA